MKKIEMPKVDAETVWSLVAVAGSLISLFAGLKKESHVQTASTDKAAVKAAEIVMEKMSSN